MYERRRALVPLAWSALVMSGIDMLGADGRASTTLSQADPAVLSAQDEALENEIIVMAERARTVRFKFNIDDRTRRVRCKIVRSSGDKAFDGAMCQPIHRCAKVEPFDAPTVNACIERERKQVFRELAEARRGQ
jgi:hypothetical protein